MSTSKTITAYRQNTWAKSVIFIVNKPTANIADFVETEIVITNTDTGKVIVDGFADAFIAVGGFENPVAVICPEKA